MWSKICNKYKKASNAEYYNWKVAGHPLINVGI